METKENELLATPRFRVTRIQVSKSDGNPAPPREVVRHPGSVVIIPLVDKQHVCLIRNRRVSVDKTLIELPAGTLEPNEPPRDCAARELIEETGYRCQSLEFVRKFYPAPGILDECMHMFMAQDLTEGKPAREMGEEIENLVVSLDDAIEMIRRGEIEDAKTIVGLMQVRFL